MFADDARREERSTRFRSAGPQTNSCEQARRSSKLAPVAALWLCAIPLRAQTPPRAPTVCENCWPTECGPGNWSAGGTLHARARPANSAILAFSLQPGDTFVVDSSVVWVTQFGRAVLQQRYEDYAPGDTVLITAYAGEGHYRIWWRGRSRNYRRFWGRDSAQAKLLNPVQQEWWIHGRLGRRSGWLAISDSTPVRNLDCP